MPSWRTCIPPHGISSCVQGKRHAEHSIPPPARSDQTGTAPCRYLQRARRIEALGETIKALDDQELAAKTEEFRARLKQGQTKDEILEEVFAVVREASSRVMSMRHYPVQLVSARNLSDCTGRICTFQPLFGSVYLIALPELDIMVADCPTELAVSFVSLPSLHACNS